MARRNDHTHEELMRLTVEAAGALVDELGHRGVTARLLADRIGYTPGTLYSHFANLDDVFLHVNLMSLKQLRLDWGGEITGDRDPEQIIRSMAYLYADFATRHRRRFQLLVHAALPAAPDEVPAYVKQNVQQLHRLLADQLQRLNPDLA